MPCLDDTRALFILSQENSLRTGANKVVNSKPFFLFVLAVIILNMAVLAINQPKYPAPEWAANLLWYLEIGFVSIFGLEMVIKIVAMGLVLHPDAYLRDAWNAFDCFLVIISIVALALDFPGISALVTFRVLRPLRTINHIKRLKMLINALVMSIPAVTTNFLFLIYFIFVAALLGLHLWAGNFSQVCYYPEGSPHAAQEQDTGSSSDISFASVLRDFSTPQLQLNSSAASSNMSNASLDSSLGFNTTDNSTASDVLDGELVLAADLTVCGPEFSCPYNGTCMRNLTAFRASPFAFDTIGKAMLLVFKSAILDNWTDELIPAVNSGGLWAVIYFIVITMIAGYFLVNVFLAILMSEYTLVTLRLRKRAKEREARKRERKALQRVQSELQLMGANAELRRSSQVALMQQQEGANNNPAQGQGTAPTYTAVQPFDADGGGAIASDKPAPRLHEAEHLALSNEGDASNGNNNGGDVAQGNQQQQHRTSGGFLDAASPTGNSSTRPSLSDTADIDEAAKRAEKRREKEERKAEKEREEKRLREEEQQRQKQERAMKREQALVERDKNVKFLIQENISGGLDDDDIDFLDNIIHQRVNNQDCGGGGDDDDINLYQKLSVLATSAMEGTYENGNHSDDDDDDSINSDESFENMRLKTLHRKGGLDSDDDLSDVSDLFPDLHDPDAKEEGDAAAAAAVSVREDADTTALITSSSPENHLQQQSSEVKYLTFDDDALPQEPGQQQAGAAAQLAISSQANINKSTNERDKKDGPSGVQKAAKYVVYFMNVVTLLTIVAIGADHFGIDESLNSSLDFFSHCCAVLFFVELIVKIVAHGFLSTAKDLFNIIDFLVAVLAIFDFIFVFSGSLAWLRAFRGLRALRLAWQIPAVHTLMIMLLPAAKPALLILLLLFIILFIYAVLGMQFFGAAEFNVLRVQYGTIWEASLSNFIVVTGDRWGRILASGMQLNSYAAPPFFITLFGIGNFIILNLFVAVIIEQLDVLTNVRWNREKLELIRSYKGREHPPRLILPRMKTRVGRVDENGFAVDGIGNQPGSGDVGGGDDSLLSQHPQSSQQSFPPTKNSRSSGGFSGDGGEPQQLFASPVSSPIRRKGAASFATPKKPTAPRKRVIETVKTEPPTFWETRKKTKKKPRLVLQGSALFLFGPHNPLRRLLASLAYSTVLRYISVVVTIANMLFIALEGVPLDSIPYISLTSERMDSVRFYAELGFVGFYALELLIGTSARGAFFPMNEIHIMGDGSRLPGRSERTEIAVSAYFSDNWNILNFVITATAAGALLSPGYMRTFRALRALRLVIFINSVRITATAILKALPHMVVSLCLVLTTWFVFGIFGVQILKGKLYYCTDRAISEQTACTGFFNISTPMHASQIEIFSEQPLDVGVYAREWKPYFMNFDHIGQGMISLMAVALGEDWPAVMFLGTDAPAEAGFSRGYYRDPALSVFYVVFVIMGNFVSMSLLLGVLINFFIRYKKGADGTMLLTNKQRVYLLTKRIVERTLLGNEVTKPNNCLQLPFFTMTTTTKSDICPPSQPQKSAASEATDNGEPTATTVDVKNNQPPPPPTNSNTLSSKGFGKRRKNKKKNQNLVQQNFARNDDGMIIEEKPLFDVFMSVVVLLNGILLALYSLQMDEFLRFITEDVCHLAFIGIFALEFLIRVCASPSVYFGSWLNRLDCVAVIVMVLGAPYVFESYLGRAAYIARVVKCFGAIKLFTRGETAQKQLLVIASGFPALMNLVLVLLIIFFIFGVVGVDLFKDVKLQGPLSELRNFQHLWNAFLILYQTMSTNAWHSYMLACMVNEPNCSMDLGNCGSLLSYPYFIIFVLLSYVIILQLCVAIVVEHFEDIESAGDGVVQSLLELREMWREIGGTTKKTLPVENLVYILKRLPKNLTKLEPPVQPKHLFVLLYRMKIPLRSDLTVSYRSTVLAVVRYIYGIDSTTMERVSQGFAEDIPDDMHFSVGHMIAARSIWKTWRQKRERMAEQRAAASQSKSANTNSSGSPTMAPSQHGGKKNNNASSPKHKRR